MKITIKKEEFGYGIKIIPENKEDKEYLEDWNYYIEKYFDKEKNLILLI